MTVPQTSLHRGDALLAVFIPHQQEEKAGEIHLSEGNFERAVELFMQAGLPSKASGVVCMHSNQQVFRPQLVAAVADSLTTCGLLDRAGDLYQLLGDTDAALAAYR